MPTCSYDPEIDTQCNGSRFFHHKDKIEAEIAKSISTFGEKTKLRDACEYAMTNGGKRFRPLIVLFIADALGQNLNVYDSALAVEFFHTASLIADDLPLMDDADERRGRPTLHKVYGDTIALLASYSLITAAFEKIHANAALMKKEVAPFSSQADQAGMIALEMASSASGITGATGGQFLDLFPPQPSVEAMRKLIHMKTVTLFEVSFIFGWVFGGGDLSLVDEVKKCAGHFGMAFQVGDDIADAAEDEKDQREMNMACLIGKTRALALFEEELAHLELALKNLKLYTPSFRRMIDLLRKVTHSAL